MKRKTFSLSVEAGMGQGKDKPPALPHSGGNHEEFLTEIMERMERMEATNRKVKLLTDIEERVAKLEEAAANAAAAPASDNMEVVTVQDAALIKAFLHRKMDDILASFFKRHPQFGEAMMSCSGMYAAGAPMMEKLPSQLMAAPEDIGL